MIMLWKSKLIWSKHINLFQNTWIFLAAAEEPSPPSFAFKWNSLPQVPPSFERNKAGDWGSQEKGGTRN